jgi:hypothetical protein
VRHSSIDPAKQIVSARKRVKHGAVWQDKWHVQRAADKMSGKSFRAVQARGAM